MNFKIEKDKYIGKWIVWEQISNNAHFDRFHGKTKKECKEWINTNG